MYIIIELEERKNLQWADFLILTGPTLHAKKTPLSAILDEVSLSNKKSLWDSKRVHRPFNCTDPIALVYNPHGTH